MSLTSFGTFLRFLCLAVFLASGSVASQCSSLRSELSFALYVSLDFLGYAFCLSALRLLFLMRQIRTSCLLDLLRFLHARLKAFCSALPFGFPAFGAFCASSLLLLAELTKFFHLTPSVQVKIVVSSPC